MVRIIVRNEVPGEEMSYRKNTKVYKLNLVINHEHNIPAVKKKKKRKETSSEKKNTSKSIIIIPFGAAL